MAGRPTKLTEARIESICTSIGLGAPYEAAAKANGIHPATLYRWKEHGELVQQALVRGAKLKDLSAQDRLAATFCEGIEKAEAEAELRALKVIDGAITGRPAEYDDDGNLIRAEVVPSWQAGMTYLERKHPDRWAKRLHVKDETPTTPAEADTAQIARFAEAFAVAYGDQLPDVDPENLMPPVAIEGTGRELTAGDS